MTQYADILILALIALFVVLRLRNTLGKDIGHKPDFSDLRKHLSGEKEEKKVVNLTIEGVAIKTPLDEEKEMLQALGDPALIAGIDAIRTTEPSFSVQEFLEGAKSAFDWVIKAYREGDLETLKNLLHPEIFKEYQTALEAAIAADAKAETTLVKITDAQPLSASLENNRARITVRFLSEQVQLTRNSKGEIIAGDASKIEMVEDEWVFERDIKSKNPNWQILDT